MRLVHGNRRTVTRVFVRPPLLAQTNGFEGLGRFVKPLEADGLSAADGPNRGESPLHLDAASSSACPVAQNLGHAVAGRGKLLGLDPPTLRPFAEDLLNRPADQVLSMTLRISSRVNARRVVVRKLPSPATESSAAASVSSSRASTVVTMSCVPSVHQMSVKRTPRLSKTLRSFVAVDAALEVADALVRPV